MVLFAEGPRHDAPRAISREPRQQARPGTNPVSARGLAREMRADELPSDVRDVLLEIEAMLH